MEVEEFWAIARGPSVRAYTVDLDLAVKLAKTRQKFVLGPLERR